jgi:hypothetical protein
MGATLAEVAEQGFFESPDPDAGRQPMKMRVNYYANGDWVGGHHWSGPRAANHALGAFQHGNYSRPYVYRYQAGFGHGMSIQLSDATTRHCIVIEPIA